MSRGLLIYLGALVLCALSGGGMRLLRSPKSASGQLVSVSFAGGILLGAAFFHMIPDAAAALGPALGWPLAAGFSIIAVLEHFFIVHPHPEEPTAHGQQRHVHVGLAAAVGISFHSLLDGFAVAASYGQPKLGPVVLIAVVAHKMPEAFALTSLLLLDEWSRSATMVWLGAYAFSTPVGAMATRALLRGAASHLIASAIAFSAGTFLAIAASDIVPRIQQQRFDDGQTAPLFAFLIGLVVSWFSVLLEQLA